MELKRFTLILCFLFVSGFTKAQDSDVKAWTEDIDYYKSELEKRHIDLYNKISKAQFEASLDQIKSRLSAKTDIEIIIDLMRLTRSIGDGHTAFSLSGLSKSLYPFDVYKIDGAWRVIKVSEEHKDLLGMRLVKIDDRKIDLVEQEVKQVAQYVENQQSEDIRTGSYMVVSELLYSLGLTANELYADFTFIDDSGKEIVHTIKAVDEQDYYANTSFESIEVDIPQLMDPIEKKHDFLWFSPIKDTDAVYIKFESYPSFEQMEVFGESVLRYIKANESKQVIIDLRDNGGGDFFVGTFLAYYLNLADSIDWLSGVYVLTDKVTFSAATSNAAQFRQMLNATIVGEASGSNPTGYQDMGQFELPNSGMRVTYSKRLFRFQEKLSQGVQPDVLIEYDWNSFFNGRDNMMEWIINDIRSK